MRRISSLRVDLLLVRVDLLLEEECILVACRVAFALALLEGGFPSCEKDFLFEGGSPPCEGGSPS